MTVATRPVWEMTASQYQAMMGVHQPYIAEISPYQYGSMGQRAKAQYDEKRRGEWNASSAVKSGWKRLVVEAFERGDFALDDAGVTSEAKTAIFWHKKEQEDARIAERMKLARRENAIGYDTDLRVGDRVYVMIGGYYTTITKVNQKSVRVQSRFFGSTKYTPENGHSHGDYTINKRYLTWMHYNELLEAATNDTPIVPRRGDADAA